MKREEIVAICPLLADDPAFEITSDPTRGNNCFAWAAGDEEHLWDPTPYSTPTRAGLYWPAGVPLLYTMKAYVAAYQTIGYEECEDYHHEESFEKIVLYADPQGDPASSPPSHAARQLRSGLWTSRLGRGNDIQHSSVEALVSIFYGPPVKFLKRLVD